MDFQSFTAISGCEFDGINVNMSFVFAGFVIFPGKNWVLQTNSWYEILIEVYDRDSNKMFPANIPVSLNKKKK